MRIFITGGTGLVGRRLVVDRLERGDQVVVCSRRPEHAAKLFAVSSNPNVSVAEGDPAAPGSWQGQLDGCDAVVHLAGAGIADRRWTAAYRRTLVNSRIDSAHQVVNAISGAANPPRLLIAASAVGYYGDRGSETLDESAAPGDDFLAHLAVQWEAQAQRAQSGSTRVVIVRLGTVLDERGGMLGKLLPIFRLGLGGRWGSGRQYLSWVHWRDLVGIIDQACTSPAGCPVMNATSPNPVTVSQFARALGQALRRPAVLPVPIFALRVTHGPIAEVMAASARAIPRCAEQEGYRFLYPRLDDALAALLRRDRGDETPEPVAMTSDVSSAPAVNPQGAVVDSAATTNSKLAAPRLPVRLLAIDVDGTLLRTDGRMAQGVVHACRHADRTRCVIVLATARPPRGMRSILQALDVVGPVINYNGAMIWNSLDARPQHHEVLDGALVRSIITDARALVPELMVGLEINDAAFTDRIDTKLQAEAGLAVEPDCVGPLEPHFSKPITRLDLAGSTAQLSEVNEMIGERYWRTRRIAVFKTSPFVTQITHPMVDKGIALQRIAKQLGVQRDEVMAIGDAENDLGMIEWAGFSVAVENARPAVKRLVDQIVPSNDEQGVARAIHRFVMSRR